MVDVHEYFEKWSEYLSFEGGIPFFMQWNVNNILTKIPSEGDCNILDMGTGSGFLLIQIAEYNRSCSLVGVDFSQRMIDRARKNARLKDITARLIKAELTSVPMDDCTVDYVVSNNAFHHVEDKPKLYSEIFRLLKPGGALVYSDSHDAPDDEFREAEQQWRVRDATFASLYKRSADSFWRALPERAKREHPREYHHSFDQVRLFLKDAGFRDIAIFASPAYFAIVSAKK